MSLALRYRSVQQTVKCEVSSRREVHARSFWGASGSTRPLFGEVGDELLVPASRHLQRHCSVPGEAVPSLGLTDITQAAVSKNSLLFMNQRCLYNVAVADSPGSAPQCCLHMLLLFAMY